MSSPRKSRRPSRPRSWQLQDAKTRLSELIRRAQSEGPQHVTVHGRGTVVVLSEEEYSRLSRARSGQQLVDLLGASPLRDIEIEHPRVGGPVRDVDL
jgi:prevent-host-death family protein